MSGPVPTAMAGTRRRRLVFAAIFAGLYAVLVGIYWPALHGAFLWNDLDYVTKPALQPISGLREIWAHPGATEQYYPLLHTAFWIEHRLWGESPLGYHLFTLALHALGCVLFLVVLDSLSRPVSDGEKAYPRQAAWLAAALFAVHPVCVESVAWISEQKNTLSLVFGLAAVLAYLRFERVRTPGSYAVASVWFLCAIMSKSLTATLPAVLWVLAWWRRGCLHWCRDLLPLLPWCGIGAVVGVFTAWDERHFGGAEGVHFALSGMERCIIAGRAVWFYLGKIVWPHPLIFFYEHWTLLPGHGSSYVAVAGVIAASGLLAWYAPKSRGPLCCWLLFLGTLFPVLGFLNVYAFVFSYVADHWQYVSILPILAGMAAGWVTVTETRGGGGVRWGIPLVVLAVCAVLSFRQTRGYASDETLYRTTLEKNPQAWLPHANLGTMAMAAGHPDIALGEYQAAAALVAQPELHANIGDADVALHRLPEAIEAYRAAIEMRPDYAVARVGLARALMIQDHFGEAIPQYREALTYQPNRADWLVGMGLALAEAGRPADAVASYEAAIALDRNFAEAYNNEGTALADLGRVGEGIAKLRTAVRLKPDYADARKNLAVLLDHSASAFANRGGLAQAIPLYREAVGLSPDLVAARCDLGLALTLGGQLPEALRQLDEAVRRDPRNALARAYRGLALSRSGRIAEAIADYDQSLALSPGDQDVLYQREEAKRRLATGR